MDGVHTVLDNASRITRQPFEIELERSDELKSRLKKAADIKADLKNRYLIKGWLMRDTISVIYGPSHVGKTFMALDMAAHVACGEPWRGNRVRQGRVVYIACEGEAGISNRIAAIRDKMPSIDESPFLLLPTRIDLFEGIDPEALSLAVSDFEPDLLVIDTMSRAMGTGDENTSKDMNQFLHGCDVLRRNANAHLMIIHHSGKDAAKGMRGSTALKAAIETELEIDEERTLAVHKQRDGAKKPSPITFDLKDVVLGTDEDGDEVTSAIVTDATKTAAGPKQTVKTLAGKAQAAWFSLDEAMQKHGEKQAGHSRDIPANVTVVPLEVWRAEFYTRAFAEDVPSNTKKKGFQRAVDKLLDVKLINIYKDVVWTRTDAQ